MKQTAIILMIITIFSKLFGFSREIILSYFYGASSISDAYLVALTIPGTIFSFIGTGISTGYIPMYSKIEQERNISEGIKFTNNLVNIIIVISTIIVILGIAFTEPLVRLFASGFEGETLVLAVKFTKISLLGIYFTGLIYIYNGLLQIKGNFIIPSLIGFPLNIIMILSIIISSTTNILALSIGSVLATASQVVLLIPFIYKKGYRYKFMLNIKDKYINNLAYISLPIILGVSINQINVLVDKTLASNIAIGGVSALNYANRLNLFVQGLFVTTVSTVIYPMISAMVTERNIDGLKKILAESISSINLLVIPATFGFMVFSNPIVKLLFGRGAFDTNAILMTSDALFFYSIGMIGVGLREVLSRAFYSMQDTKTPMINAAISLVLNIILNLILSKFMGIGGLALATSISAIFCTGLLFISFRKKLGSFGLKSISISSMKIIAASLIMGALAKISFEVMTRFISDNLSLIASICIGGAVYFIIIYFMKIEEVDIMINAVKKKLKRKVISE